jgi:hypothetical protein
VASFSFNPAVSGPAVAHATRPQTWGRRMAIAGIVVLVFVGFAAAMHYAGLDSLMSSSPLTISDAATRRDALAVSPRKISPAAKAPAAPIP